MTLLSESPSVPAEALRGDAGPGPLADVVGAGLEVPLVTGGTVRYVNLDYAASAPALRAVADQVTELLPLYSSVHRGAGYASAVCTSAYEAARATVASFTGARRDDVAIFTRNTTDALNLLAAAVPAERRDSVRHAIAVAGTATSLAAIAQGLDPYDAEKVHGYMLSAGECERILERLSKMTLAERRRVPGLHPDRAPTIIAGAIIFREVILLFGVERIEISEHDILRGAALDLIK